MASDKKRDHDNQAEQLKKRLEENNLVKPSETVADQQATSSLPPRSKVHTKTETKQMKWRIRYPLVRLLALIFILMVFLVPGYHIWKNQVQPVESEQAGEEKIKSENIEVIEMDKADGEGEPPIDDEFEFAEDSEEPEPTMQKEENIKEKNEAKATEIIEVVEQTGEKLPERAKAKTYIVQPGDNLFRISLKFYKDRSGEQIIKEANGITDIRNIEPGMKLIIPVTK